MSLFTISELSGSTTIFCEKGQILSSPKSEADAVNSQQFIQIKTTKTGETKFLVAHNNGTDEVVMVTVGESMCFFSVTDKMHTALTVCLNRKFADGSFLVIQTMVSEIASIQWT